MYCSNACVLQTQVKATALLEAGGKPDLIPSISINCVHSGLSNELT